MSGTHHIADVKDFSVRRARLNQGMSLRQLAKAIEIAPQTLTRIEAGDDVHPSSAKKVADYFGVQVTDLMPAEREAA